MFQTGGWRCPARPSIAARTTHPPEYGSAVSLHGHARIHPASLLWISADEYNQARLPWRGDSLQKTYRSWIHPDMHTLGQAQEILLYGGVVKTNSFSRFNGPANNAAHQIPRHALLVLKVAVAFADIVA